ncbi:MAG TPA: FtsX-like permease family protein [Solirubrobacteraceae bacterium]|jgi:putative ABC transport system permease protein|nr:FtsX-like permease family protein [Solirubrobacteraceae bacterium]
MKLSGIRYIYEARLGARAVLVQEGFAILGIAVGVALLFASQVSSTSLARSVAQLNSQLVGDAQLQFEVRGPEGVSERLLEEVRRVPGVQVALPILEHQVNVIGRRGERSVDLIGVEPQSLHASGPLLRRFSAKQLAQLPAIAMPAPLASEIGIGPLETVRLQVGTRFVETLVGATLQEADIGGLVHSPVVVASIRYAQRLTDTQGQLTRIFVRFDQTRTSEVRPALARLAARWDVNLLPSDFNSRLFAVAVAPESKSEQLFSGISALVGFMFALNAMLITVPSRRKLISDVRPHGATRWMTIQILLFDAAVIGALACALGLALGDVLSIAVFHATPAYLAVAFPVGNNRIVTWQSVALAVSAGMAASVVGVLWPVREILARPLQPPSDPADHRRRWILARLVTGVLCLLITTLTLVADTQAAVVGNVALVIALVCLLPLMFNGLVAAFEYVSDLFDGVSSALAVTELQTPQTRVRSLAIAATAAVAVFGIVEFQGTQTNLERGLQSSIRGTDSSADIWVIPSGRSGIQPTTPFDPIHLSTLSSVPGVGRLGIYRGSFLNWGDRRLWVIAPGPGIEHPVPASQLVSGNAKLASERVRQGGWAVLSQALAEEHHLRVGQTFTLPSPRPQILRVAGLTTNLGWPPGAIILSSEGYARAWISGDPSAYEIDSTPGTPVVAVRERVQRALGSSAGLTVETSTEREQRDYAAAAQGLSRLAQIRLLVLIAAILAVVGAMASMIWQRRDRIAFNKCHGFGEAVLWRALLCESAVLLTAGCSIGAVFGLYAQLLGSHFLATVTGFPVVFDIEGTAAISGFALVSVIALAMLALPGYLVVRVQPRTVSPAY